MAKQQEDLTYGGVTNIGDYEESIARPKSISGGETLNDLVTRYPTGQAFLGQTHLPFTDPKDKGDSLAVQLRETAKNPALQAPVTAVEDKMKVIFSTSRTAMMAVQAKFNETYQGLTDQVKAATPAPFFKYSHLPKYLETLKKETLQEIEPIQKQELADLKSWLDQPTTDATLQAAFPLSTPDVIKKQLISKLEETHKAQTESIEKSLDKAHEEQYRHIGQERERINLLRLAETQSESLKDQIRKANANTIGTTTMGANAPGSQYKGVDLEKLNGLITVTGNQVDKGDTISFPRLGLNARAFAHYLPFADSLPFKDYRSDNYQDILWLAKKIKARGEVPIILNVSTNNPQLPPEKLREVERDCYKAAIAAGYDPKDIIINGLDKEHKMKVVCGLDKSGEKEKRIPASELFAGREGELKKIEEMGKRVLAAEKSALDPRKTQADYKTVLDQLRALGAQAQQAPVTMTMSNS